LKTRRFSLIIQKVAMNYKPSEDAMLIDLRKELHAQAVQGSDYRLALIEAAQAAYEARCEAARKNALRGETDVVARLLAEARLIREMIIER
jgi:hypothetical protein